MHGSLPYKWTAFPLAMPPLMGTRDIYKCLPLQTQLQWTSLCTSLFTLAQGTWLKGELLCLRNVYSQTCRLSQCVPQRGHAKLQSHQPLKKTPSPTPTRGIFTFRLRWPQLGPRAWPFTKENGLTYTRGKNTLKFNLNSNLISCIIWKLIMNLHSPTLW